MVNKKSLWFLTLFSLILVLSVYYITMPNELLLTNNSIDSEIGEVVFSETTILTALRVESDAQVELEIEELTSILTSNETDVDEKNSAYEQIKDLNLTKSEEESLEKSIKEEFELDSYVKIDYDQVRVVVTKSDLSEEEANLIMRHIQEQYDTKMYISVTYSS
ncbi:MAG: SpoIIIAH-like family protein [Mycoplasmatota bacterium]